MIVQFQTQDQFIKIGNILKLIKKTKQLSLSFNHTKTIDEMIRTLKVAKANLSIAKMNMDFLLSIHDN